MRRRAASGLRDAERANPARWSGHLEYKLADPGKISKRVHHPALPHALMPEFMKRLQGIEGTAARLLEFIVLTCARRDEARFATWVEVDLDSATWTVPSDRMKPRVGHQVALSEAAARLLKAMPRDGELIFAPAYGASLGSAATVRVIAQMNEFDDGKWVDPASGRAVVAHGLRATFRTWAADSADFPRELVETALAHAVMGKVEASYQRSNLLERRRPLMQSWADHCDGKRGAARVVVPMRRKARA